MRRLMERLRAHGAHAAAVDSLEQLTEALRAELQQSQQTLASLSAQFEATQAEHRALLKSWRKDLDQRARLVATRGPVALTDALSVDGPPHRRASIRRLRVGRPFEQRFDRWMGVTRCVAASPEARAHWERLLASEMEASGGTLRSAPATVLDLGAATVVRMAPNGALVTLLDAAGAPAPAAAVMAVPRFAFRRMPRKLRNFGHWLLDYLPQVVALRRVAPEAAVLVPDPVARFQRATLALVGVADDQIRPWNGEPVTAERVVLLEHDGRMGGGRPLALLRDMHDVLQRSVPASKRTRRLYISRRDAKRSRQWVLNQQAVEAVFAERGFEVLTMKGMPLDEQARLFADAHIVAGISGAGLSDLVFSAPGTHLVVLHSDSLMQWYSVDQRARSRWRDTERARRVELAELGDSPRFYAHLAASLSQYCHSFLGPDEMPTGELSAFLDDVLNAVERM
jgi:hypothetical protein